MSLHDPSAEIPTGDLILFDGVCIFCSGFAHFMAKADKASRFAFVTAQSPTGRALFEAHDLDPDEIETNIVIVEGEPYFKFRAFAAAMRAIGWPWRLFAIVGYVPKSISDAAYNLVARNRYRIAGKRVCPMPTPELKARLIE